MLRDLSQGVSTAVVLLDGALAGGAGLRVGEDPLAVVPLPLLLQPPRQQQLALRGWGDSRGRAEKRK